MKTQELIDGINISMIIVDKMHDVVHYHIEDDARIEDLQRIYRPNAARMFADAMTEREAAISIGYPHHVIDQFDRLVEKAEGLWRLVK